MATQTTQSSEQSQQSPGQAIAKGSQGQLEQSRRGGYAMGIPLIPADFFRMNPFSLMRRMTEELDRTFSEVSGRDFGDRVWIPAIELTQRAGNYVVRAEVPGLHPNDVKLEIADDTIVIQGERKVEHEETKGGLHVTERRYGKFYRAIPLPEGAKADEASARYENGVLEVTVPVEEQGSKRREIPIQASSTEPAGKPSSSGSAGASGKAA
jgi:HSP20 family protein